MMEEKEITLHQFVSNYIRDINLFYEWWIYQQEEHGEDNYPPKMDIELWDHWLLDFKDFHNKDKKNNNHKQK